MESTAKSIDSAQTAINVFNAGLTSIAATYVPDMLKGWGLKNPAACLISAAICVSAVFLAFDYIGRKAFKNFHWLRRKLFGRAYVEGIWVDVSIDPNTMEVVNAAISRFFYTNGALHAEGEAFDGDGNFIAKYDVMTSEYTEGYIRYAFWGHIKDPIEYSSSYGNGHANFNVRGPADVPSEYTGFYMDTDRKRKFELVGWINRKDAVALFSMTRESKGIYLKKRIADVRARLHAKCVTANTATT